MNKISKSTICFSPTNIINKYDYKNKNENNNIQKILINDIYEKDNENDKVSVNSRYNDKIEEISDDEKKMNKDK